MMPSHNSTPTLVTGTLAALQRRLSEVPRVPVRGQGLASAAVLALLFTKDAEWHILLNRRSELVGRHKGEICFPGGAWEPQDSDHLATALRETQEEMGIDPKDVEVLGDLAPVIVPTGFLVRPVVGSIPYPYPFQVNPAEVAEVLEVPVSALLQPANLREQASLRGGALERSYSYAYQRQLVYGATARILTQLLGFLAPLLGKEVPWRSQDSTVSR
jgi:8-oxo-dGTP pyrophosphatase MutT (NUDIX family)